MKKELSNILKDWKSWAWLTFIYLNMAAVAYLDLEFYVILTLAIISAIITVVTFITNKDSVDTILINRKIASAFRKISKQKKPTNVYQMVEKELIPIIKKQTPKKIYKYYKLTEDKNKNIKVLNAVKEQSIWSSVCVGFNDPFECEYAFLNKDILSVKTESGRVKVEELWDIATKEIKERLTTICFTQNPNDMSMWAHYANEHKGFCVEYEVINNVNLFPVTYVEKRMEAQLLLLELVDLIVYDINNKDRWANLLCYMRFLSTFKDKSWEHENEIRAVFLNFREEIQENGRLFPCSTVGVVPTKLYVGTMCEKGYEDELHEIAESLGIEYEKCAISTDRTFSVIHH